MRSFSQRVIRKIRDRMSLDCLDREWGFTNQQRREMTRKAIKATTTKLPSSSMIAFGVFFSMALIGLGGNSLASFAITVPVVLACICVGMVIGLGFACYLKRHLPREIRRVLQQAGLDVCSRCGYWMRGLEQATSRCPECGAKDQDMHESCRMPKS